MSDLNAIKESVRLVQKGGLVYETDAQGDIKKYKSWLGDAFAFLYDRIMEKNIFPKKFGAELALHNRVLAEALTDVHEKNVLELGTGSGAAVQWLAPDNRYTGVDVSPGLLKRAVKKFAGAGFDKTRFHIADVEDMPFNDHSFDLCLCILTLNFFDNAEAVLQEVFRLLKPGGRIVCSVPVPERNKKKRVIRGVLRSEEVLKQLFEDHQFLFRSFNVQNGAVLYFQAQK